MLDRDVTLAGHIEDAWLHELREAPECLRLIVESSQEGGKEVSHPLTIADLRLVNQVVKEDVPAIIGNNSYCCLQLTWNTRQCAKSYKAMARYGSL